MPTIRPARRWTAPRTSGAAAFLIGAIAIGFLLTYFLLPVKNGAAQASNVIPPPLPKPPAGSALTASEAPTGTGTDATAYQELARIAAQDRPTLQSTQLWRTQVASSPATQSAAAFLKRYRTYIAQKPDLLLAWSGDWPHTWGPSSQHSWVLLSSSTSATTAPILRVCNKLPAAQRCWAIRLSTVGDNSTNEDSGKPDPNNN